MRFARIVIAEIPIKQFDEITNTFLDGIKDAIKDNQIPEAKKRLHNTVAKAMQSGKLKIENGLDFKETVEKSLAYLRTNASRDERRSWRKLGVTEEAMQAADDYSSWRRMVRGDYDEEMKLKTKEGIKSQSAEELYTDVDLLQEIFDQITMSFAQNTDALQKLNNARMLLEGFQKFVLYPAMNMFKKENRKHEYKKFMNKDKEEYIVDLLQPETDKEVVKEFIDYLNHHSSLSGFKLNEMKDAAELVVKYMTEELKGKSKLNAASFFKDYQKELKLLGVDTEEQIRRLIGIIKNIAKEFVDKEAPGLSKSILRDE